MFNPLFTFINLAIAILTIASSVQANDQSAKEMLGWKDLQSGTYRIVSITTERDGEPLKRVVNASIGDTATVTVDNNTLTPVFEESNTRIEIERDEKRKRNDRTWTFGRSGVTHLSRVSIVDDKLQLGFWVVYTGSFVLEKATAE